MTTEPYEWIEGTLGRVPSNAVQVGVDVDGQKIFIGKALFAGDLLPAKIIPGRRAAYVGHDGKEHEVRNFKLLCEKRFHWVPSRGSNIPDGAVEGGKTRTGEKLYIGRVNHRGATTIAKVHPSHSTAYVPFGGEEIGYKDYEILVFKA